ncbi:MAG: MATE family efflux transporter [Lachnospiraceae bacterium]|nr:MATE family efflux transporter [Lachnospiraceae bacterium]
MNIQTIKKKLVGDRHFYRKVLTVTVPIMLQNGITNFVNMLDNIMVGQVGTEQMSGVAIVNQLMFVFNLCVFGAVAGAGILGAQFYGSGNHEGVRYTFRFKMYICLAISALGLLIFGGMGDTLIQLYLHSGSETGDIYATLEHGRQYMLVMMAGLIPFAVVQSYAGTLRESGETMVPMIAGITAVLVNLVGNYILIFGKFGAPMLGVQGAAIATVISRFVELGIIVFWTHSHKEKHPFIKGVYRSLYIPGQLVRQILVTGMPLLINEGLWSGGMAMITQCYSVRGLAVVAGINIANTLTNVFNVVFLSLGNAVGIIVGQLLGAGKLEQARDEDRKIIAFATFLCLGLGVLLYVVAPLFPLIYNTDQEVRELATSFMRITAICMPLYGITNTAYFTLRSGGKTIITFLFDSAFVWSVVIPIVYCLSHFTGIHVVWVYAACQATELIKAIVGLTLVYKGVWIQKIVAE